MKHTMSDGRDCCEREFDAANLVIAPWCCKVCRSTYFPFITALPGKSEGAVLWVDLDTCDLHEKRRRPVKGGA